MNKKAAKTKATRQINRHRNAKKQKEIAETKSWEKNKNRRIGMEHKWKKKRERRRAFWNRASRTSRADFQASIAK